MKYNNITKLIMKEKRVATWLHKTWAIAGGALLLFVATVSWWFLLIGPHVRRN